VPAEYSAAPLTTKKAAGAVLTAKQAPHRPGTAPALGLRAGIDVGIMYCADPLLKGIQSIEEVDSCFS
jgi:hypothetical protein